MSPELLARYAALLSDYCLSLSAGQRVYIQSTYLAEPLLKALQAHLLPKDVFIDFGLSFDGQDRLYFEHVNDIGLDDLSPIQNLVGTQYDAIMTIRAPFDVFSLRDADGKKKTRHQQCLMPYKQQILSRSANGELRWVLCQYPTQSSADVAGLSLSDYTQFVSHACHLDSPDPIQAWTNIRHEQAKIVTLLNTCEHFQFKGPHIDISFSTKGRRWINSDGSRNMPSGEVFTSPIEASVQGHVTFSYPTVYGGKDVSQVHLSVKDGQVCTWSAAQGQSVLDDIFSVPSARYFGEVAIGTNPNIQQITKNILFDEKIGGSIHMAVGASYPETGGKNESPIHWDLITDMSQGGRIIADGTCIYQDGQFIF